MTTAVRFKTTVKIDRTSRNPATASQDFIHAGASSRMIKMLGIALRRNGSVKLSRNGMKVRCLEFISAHLSSSNGTIAKYSVSNGFLMRALGRMQSGDHVCMAYFAKGRGFWNGGCSLLDDQETLTLIGLGGGATAQKKAFVKQV